MIAVSQSRPVTHEVRLRPIALPVEHGGWSLLLEPAVLGLLLAPSLAGVFLSVAAIALFLARHPYKLSVKDWRMHRRGRRAVIAERFALFYLLLGMLAAGLAIKSGGITFLVPLAFAAPFAITQLILDSMGHSRSLAAELAGAAAPGALAASLAIGGGWQFPTAFALWVIMAARAMPTILYLRARLRLMRRKAASRSLPIIAHLAAPLATFGLCAFTLAPWLALWAMLVLTSRAIVGLWSSNAKTTAQRLGLMELGLGVITVLAVALGFRFEL